VTVNIDARRPKSLFCKDWFFIANTELMQVETITETGLHQITFTNLDKFAWEDLQYGGLKVFMFCDGYIDTFISAFKMLLCFLGGMGTDPNLPIMGSHVPPYMEHANVEFLKSTMNYDLVERPQTYIEYDPDLIQSGDFIGIMRLDGLDPLIMYGSGTYAGHSVMALRFDGELYIIESQDGWYWPIHGIQRNKWADWVTWARNADFHFVHMPLKPEARERFNEAAAQKFFFDTEGLPYGYHNFLFGWIDTAEDNWPPLLPQQFGPIIFALLEKVAPATADIFYSQAINKRLGVESLKIEELAALAGERGLTLDDVMALPEEEGWEYHGIEPRDGRAYVCSAYVAAVYQAAGMFYPDIINGPEFTPKDVYTLDIFDLDYKRPAICEEVDPGQPFCQINGKYRMKFPGYTTIKPYNKMAEHCPTIAPTYERPDGC